MTKYVRLTPCEPTVGQVWSLNSASGGRFRIVIDIVDSGKALCHTLGHRPRAMLVELNTLRYRRRGARREVVNVDK